jgi:tetratricopeptide (TPR) repeat protein
MKRVQVTLLIMLFAVASLAVAQNDQGKQKKGKGQTAAQPAPAPVAPAGAKLPPQAKTQEEFAAFQQAYSVADPAAAEQAAEAYCTQFKDSDLRMLLYRRLMTMYQSANNAEKTIEMGRKVLEFDSNNPEALVTVASVLSERTRESDLDKDTRLSEATADAQKALKAVETDLMVSPGTPPEKIEEAKNMLRSMAWGAMGSVELTNKNYPAAETNLRKAIEYGQAQPDPVTHLRLSVVLDHEQKYAEALPVAEKALQLSPPGSQEALLAKQERDRLLKLTGAPAPAATPAAQPAAPAAAPSASSR